MRGFAKSVLISIIATICILLFTNFIFFFPWYTTLIVQTFNLSQIVASDNYLKESNYEDALEDLRNRPIYRDNANKIKIEVKNEDDTDAIGFDDPGKYLDGGYTDRDKPYRQRGNKVTVTVSASYPLKIKLWGQEYQKDIDVSFKLDTTGLKHYKDLDYYADLPDEDGESLP
ncbi:hypothetical protein DCC85_02080 [Paenibacillus sp. CAA11]|uniref:hypothetical protein n=1 Tax=Paenibacillus sp. CAA11 TaxID=1532905 RepID=UPI000D399338|nr:hypothetical protein [Paenibacillus sp. CAA11]AWB43138.1 hypothetical protein DCC85_02080 [Paenibacillus sp. CAA11]